ncbi:SDR family oxidoreductase [Ochrobactrum sp. XJ1]|nr:SDR family oxidoreductase [Ochrobactrum sp. XJ1]
MMRFKDKVAVVTGGAHGIGLATAKRLIAEGARVAVLDLDRVEGADDMEGLLSVAGDCTDTACLQAFFDQVERELGEIDILFNNVGQGGRERASLFVDSTEDVWRFVMEINVMTTMRSSRIMAPKMQARGKGRIINMSSNAALAGDLRLADYAAAKMGVVGFTRALAREMAPHGVTVNAVCPGAIKTRAHDKIPAETLNALLDATPVGFVAEPDEVAGLVAYIASDEARFLTGQTIALNGGHSFL